MGAVLVFGKEASHCRLGVKNLYTSTYVYLGIAVLWLALQLSLGVCLLFALGLKDAADDAHNLLHREEDEVDDDDEPTGERDGLLAHANAHDTDT